MLDFGGVESIFVLQSKLIDRAAFDFRVCTFWKKGAAARDVEKAGIQVDELNVDPSIRNPRASAALVSYLRRTRPDIVHASIGEANFHAALVSKLAGVPVTIIEEQGLPTRRLLGRLVHAGLYRRVDAVVGVSDTSCAYLTDAEWAPRNRVRKIYNCARSDFFVERPEPRAPGPFNALLVGRLVEVKNHERLLRALPAVLRKHPSFRLRLAGEGPLRARMEQLIAELGLQQNVELLGFRTDILALLQAADVFLLPSLSEGCSLALAEAMAAGTPVIGSDVGGIPEVMRDVGQRWLVPPESVEAWSDALCAIVELDEPARRELGLAAARVAKRFAPQSHIEQVQSMYRELLSARRA